MNIFLHEDVINTSPKIKSQLRFAPSCKWYPRTRLGVWAHSQDRCLFRFKLYCCFFRERFSFKRLATLNLLTVSSWRRTALRKDIQPQMFSAGRRRSSLTVRVRG